MDLGRLSLALCSAAAVLAPVSLALADESTGACGQLPGNPADLARESEPDEDRAFALSAEAYAAYEAGDCACTAYYNAEAWRHAPDTAVLLMNAAAALMRCDQPDAANRWAQATLVSVGATENDARDAAALIAETEPLLADETRFVRVDLSEREISALTLGPVTWVDGDQPRLPRGPLQVMVTTAAGQSEPRTIDFALPPVVEPEVAPVEPPPPPVAEQSTWPLWVGIGAGSAGVVLLGTALALDLAIGAERSEYDAMGTCLRNPACGEARGTTADYDALGADLEGLASAELGTLVAGSLLTAAGIGLITWHFVRGDGESSNVALLPGPASLSARLRF